MDVRCDFKNNWDSETETEDRVKQQQQTIQKSRKQWITFWRKRSSRDVSSLQRPEFCNFLLSKA